jgi:hypothetical protein
MPSGSKSAELGMTARAYAAVSDSLGNLATTDGQPSRTLGYAGVHAQACLIFRFEIR